MITSFKERMQDHSKYSGASSSCSLPEVDFQGNMGGLRRPNSSQHLWAKRPPSVLPPRPAHSSLFARARRAPCELSVCP